MFYFLVDPILKIAVMEELFNTDILLVMAIVYTQYMIVCIVPIHELYKENTGTEKKSPRH